jgi:uncharacterized membrane protein
MDSTRRRRVESMPLLLLGVALVAGLWLLPDLAPDADAASGVERHHARVVEELPAGEGPQGERRYLLEILDGDRAGEQVEAVSRQYLAPGTTEVEAAQYAAGDEVAVSIFTGAAGGFAEISDPWRLPLLAAVAALFSVVVLVVGGWRGLRSLVALAFTLTVVVKVLLPLLLRGYDAVLLALAAAVAISAVTLLLTEGPRRTTLAALLGTVAALGLTAALTAAFTTLARFSEIQASGDAAAVLGVFGGRLDPTGLLLAAVVLGALGVIDDVTVTQAAAVDQLHAADPQGGRGRLFARAMEIGRSHIAATVNTLVLAYVGASLPLLVLLAVAQEPPLAVLNGELMAVEIVRALVGSIGIAAAVPLTTAIAVGMPGATYTKRTVSVSEPSIGRSQVGQ